MRILILLTVLFCLNQNMLSAQNLPYYKTQDLVNLKNNQSDTVYVINFWATWCKPCLEELPDFEKLTTEFSTKKLQVILVSNDFSRQVDSRLKPFIKSKKLKSKVAFLNEKTPNDWMPFISEEWEGNIPATLIVCGNKGFSKFIDRQMNYEELLKIVEPLLNKYE